MKERRVVYQFSKPFQYFNIKNLPGINNAHEYKVLVAIRAFAGFDQFINNLFLVDANNWDDIIIVDNEKGLHKYLFTNTVSALYTPYDTSTLLGLVILLKGFDVYWFEEGLTTYMKSHSKKPFFQTVIDSFLGVGARLGTSKFTKGQYVYRHDVYRKLFKEDNRNLFHFKYEFRHALSVYSDLFFKLSETDEKEYDKYKDKNIAVYLTDWAVDSAVLSQLEQYSKNYDVFFIKPHPHILKCDVQFPACFSIVKSNILFEIIAQRLLDNNNRLTIYHHNSNAVIHFLKDTNVISLDNSLSKNEEIRVIYELFSI